MTDTAKSEALVPRNSVAVATRWRMIPTSLGEAMEMAQLLASSELVPKGYRGKPQDCIVAYEFGSSLGLSWMQSLRSVSVINGQAAVWGDAVPALIYGSGDCERFHEVFEGQKGTDDYTAVCILKRRGMPDEVRRTFSVGDAKVAKLWGKKGREGQDTPWITYPDRMLKMRARGFAARDAFPDKLSGLILAEEALDYQTIDGQVIASEDVTPTETPASRALASLPEGLRENIEKAFETLNLPPAMRLVKVNEHLVGDGVDLEVGAQAILDWCRDEFAKRKTGMPRAKKGEGNGKKSQSSGTAAKAPEQTGDAAREAGSSVASAEVGVAANASGRQNHTAPDPENKGPAQSAAVVTAPDEDALF